MKREDGPVFGDRGFTLLEILIALSILSISLLAIVTAQSAGVRMTGESRKMLIATMLARQKMVEVEMMMDEEGFSEFDQEEYGDFEEEFPGEFSEFFWQYSIKKIEFSIPSVPQELMEEAEGETTREDTTRTLADMGIDLSTFTDLFSRYVREVKVAVAWGEEEGEEVVLTTHLVNPSGRLAEDEEVTLEGEGGSGS